jgi:DNA primase
MVNVKYEARAPAGKEVEEITQKEILQALRNKREHGKPVARQKPSQSKPQLYKPKPSAAPQKPKQPLGPEFKNLGKIASSIIGSGQACLLKQSNNNFREIGKVPKRELSDVLKHLQNGKAQALIIDSEITQNIVNEAEAKGISIVIGARRARTLNRTNVRIFSARDLTGGQTK